jgi:hypothetical protein
MVVTCKYSVGQDLDVPAVVTDAPLVYDGLAGDTAGYYNSAGTPNQFLTIIWDLGTVSTVGRIRCRFGGKDSYSFTFQYSDDGTTWVDANTGAIPSYNGNGTFAWATEFNSTGVVATSHRYWRLVTADRAFGQSSRETRCGDYRLYNGSDIQYEVGGDPEQPHIQSIRFRRDDGSESTASWASPLNDYLQGVLNQTYRLRFAIDGAGLTGDSTQGYKIAYSYSGAPNVVYLTSTSSYAKCATSMFFSDGANTTQQIGTGIYTFITPNSGMDNNGSISSITTGPSGLFEIEFCFEVTGATVGEHVNFYLLNESGTGLYATGVGLGRFYIVQPQHTRPKVLLRYSTSLDVVGKVVI